MADETAPEVADSEWSKYIRPKSLTWWASAIPLFAGVAKALALALHVQPVVDLIETFAPGLSPAMLVNLGLIGIGLRGAIK